MFFIHRAVLEYLLALVCLMQNERVYTFVIGWAKNGLVFES